MISRVYEGETDLAYMRCELTVNVDAAQRVRARMRSKDCYACAQLPATIDCVVDRLSNISSVLELMRSSSADTSDGLDSLLEYHVLY